MAQARMGPVLYAKLLLALEPGDSTLRELADETGLAYCSILGWVRALHEAGLVHIAAWETCPAGRNRMPIYKLGRGRDAPRPKMSAASRQRRCRERAALARQLGLVAA